MAQNRTKQQKQAMYEALVKALGIVTTACKSAGISRETHYRWLTEDLEYRQRVDEIANIALDYVESKLFKQIENGDTTASIFYLKTKGKNRGYIERKENYNVDVTPETLIKALDE
jgi:hypothetical protein